MKNLNPQPKFQRRLDKKNDTGGWSRYLLMDDMSLFISNSLSNVALLGDTLCKFTDSNKTVFNEIRQQVLVRPNFYRINGHVMLQIGFSDTIFRIAPPNRLIPKYVLNWGDYKPDIREHAKGSTVEGKLVLGGLVETQRFIFIDYTEGRDYPARRNEGKIKDHWAVYDKIAKTLTHHLSSEQRVMFENDLDPLGMPFYPRGVNHRNEMYMTFSKEQIKSWLDTGKYQNNKLQAIYDNLPDDGFCLMIVK